MNKKFINKIKLMTRDRAKRFRDKGEFDKSAPKKAIRQQKSYDCGPACLRIACSVHGKDVDLEKVTELCNSTATKGTKPDEIIAAAGKLGLSAEKLLGLSIDELKKLLAQKIPVICAIQAWSKNPKNVQKLNDGHYVVAIGVKGDNIVFEDPALDSGKGYIPQKEFEARWIDREQGNRTPLKHLGIAIRKGTNMQFNAPGKLARAMVTGIEKQAGGSVAKYLRNALKSPSTGTGLGAKAARGAKRALSPHWRAGVTAAAGAKHPVLMGAAGLGVSLAAPTLYQKALEKGFDKFIGKDPYAHLRKNKDDQEQ